MQMISFAAWRDDAPHEGHPAGRHYVALAELLVRLGSYGLALTWRARTFEEHPHPTLAEVVRASKDSGIPTLELLAMDAPHRQVVNGDYEGYAGTELLITLREFDSSSWDIRTADEWVLNEIQRHYPDAKPMTSDEWDATN